MSKIITVLALFAALSAVSTPIYAADDEGSAPALQTDVDHPDASLDPNASLDRPHPRPIPPPMRRGYVCYSQNAFHQTFSVFANWRTPRFWTQNRAVQLCRANTIFFLRGSCHAIGCR